MRKLCIVILSAMLLAGCGKKTDTEYDDNGRVIKVTYEKNNYLTFEYDDNGNTIVDNMYYEDDGVLKRIKTLHDYDSNNKEIKSTTIYYDNGSPWNVNYVYREYDDNGNISKLSFYDLEDNKEVLSCWIDYLYDDSGELYRKINYDRYGNLTSIENVE